jgi:hypothetical protein
MFRCENHIESNHIQENEGGDPPQAEDQRNISLRVTAEHVKLQVIPLSQAPFLGAFQ